MSKRAITAKQRAWLLDDETRTATDVLVAVQALNPAGIGIFMPRA